MPSGSKKRKSSKKPKSSSQSEPPELDTSFDEGMAKEGEDMADGPPSPKVPVGDPEAMADSGLEAKEINGEVLQEGLVEPEEIKEGSLTDGAFALPHQQEICKDDPSPQADPEPDIGVVMDEEAPARIEPEGEAPIEISQGEPMLQIKPDIAMPLSQTDTATDAEIEREMETDAGQEMETDAAPTACEDDTGAAPHAPADEFKPEADIGLGEIELSIESAPVGREPEPSAPPVVSESRMDESPVETTPEDAAPTAFEGDANAAADAPAEPEGNIGQDEIELSIGSAPEERESEPALSESRMDESPVETAPMNIEPEIDKAPVEMEAGIDAAPVEVEPEIDEAPVEMKQETDGLPAHIEPETDEAPVEIHLETDEAPADSPPETEETLVEREPEMDAAPADVKPETDAAPANSELETGVALVEREPEMDAAPADAKPEMDASPADSELETGVALVEKEPEMDAVPADAKPETDAAPADSELETGVALVEREPEMDAAPVDIELETDAAPADVEPEMDAAPADSELETGVGLVEREPEMDAAPADVEPETDAAPADSELETDVAMIERKPEMDAAHLDVKPEMDAALADVEPEADAAPADSELETDVAQVERDAFPVEVQSEIDAAGPGIETQTDAAACEIETDHLEMEPETEATPSEMKPEVNAAPIETEQDELAQSEIELEPEPEVGALPEVRAEEEVESLDTPVEIEGEMEHLQEIDQEPKPEPEELPQEIDLEPKSETEELPQELESEAKPESEGRFEDASLEIEAKTEPPQEIKPEPEVEAVDEARPDDEELDVIKAEDETSAEAELGQQDLVEGEVGASLETNPEPEVGASHETEPDEKVCLEAEQKPEMESLAEVKSDEMGSFETELVQQDLVEIEPEQTDVQEHDQHAHIVDAPEVPVIEDEIDDQVELPAISASDAAILVDDSIPVMEASVNIDNEGAVNEQVFLRKLDEAEGISPSAVVLEGGGEGTEDVVPDDLDPGADLEQDRETSVDNERGVLDELADESKEHIDEQERAGDCSEMLVPCEQEGIELPLADAINVEESATEGALLNDQLLGTEQPQLPIDEQELLGAADEPPSAESELVERGLETILPFSESEMIVDPHESKGEAVTSALEEMVAFEPEVNLKSSSGELERDIGEEEAASSTVAEAGSVLDPYKPKDESVTSADGEKVALEPEVSLESSSGDLEEEAASSTVAEAGSVLNDLDENVHYEHELHTDYSSSEHIPDSRDFDDTLSPKAPEVVEAGLEHQLDSEPYPTKQQRFFTESNGNEVKPLASEGDSRTDEVDFKGLENPSEQAAVLLESADVAVAAEELHASFVEEVRGDVQPLSSPQPEQVIQDNKEDEVHISKEGLAANEELKLAEEERFACEDGKGAATTSLGVGSAKEFPVIAENELVSKALTTEVDRQYSLSRSEAPSNDLLDLRDESNIHNSEVNMDEAEIHAVEAKELKGAELNIVGGDSSNDASKAAPQSVSSDPEGRDIGVQAFRQKSTQEASLPVVVPAQDRALEHVNPMTSGGVIVEGRKKWLGCCGMFEVLLGKN